MKALDFLLQQSNYQKITDLYARNNKKCLTKMMSNYIYQYVERSTSSHLDSNQKFKVVFTFRIGQCNCP